MLIKKNITFSLEIKGKVTKKKRNANRNNPFETSLNQRTFAM